MKIIDCLTTKLNIDRSNILLDQPMSLHTTFKIGGPAEIFVKPKSSEEINNIYYFCHENNIPLFIIGKGSNLLVSEKGIKGVVMCLDSNYSHVHIYDDGTVTATTGTPLTKLCLAVSESNLTGLEFAYGIPGSLGGALYMNAGAWGGEIKDVIIGAKCVSPDGVINLDNKEMGFSYRSSIFTNLDYCILKVALKLTHGDKSAIQDKMDEILSKRTANHPLNYASAGSTFKRPSGHYASKLIEQCDLKGKSIGDAQVSEKHAGFIVNKGNATFDDVLKLIEFVKEDVFKKTGVTLECEVKIIN